MSESNLLYCLLKKVFCLIPFNTYCDLLFYDRKYLRCLGNLLYFIHSPSIRIEELCFKLERNVSVTTYFLTEISPLIFFLDTYRVDIYEKLKANT